VPAILLAHARFIEFSTLDVYDAPWSTAPCAGLRYGRARS
jgi:hypothetical protein